MTPCPLLGMLEELLACLWDFLFLAPLNGSWKQWQTWVSGWQDGCSTRRKLFLNCSAFKQTTEYFMSEYFNLNSINKDLNFAYIWQAFLLFSNNNSHHVRIHDPICHNSMHSTYWIIQIYQGFAQLDAFYLSFQSSWKLPLLSQIHYYFIQSHFDKLSGN